MHPNTPPYNHPGAQTAQPCSCSGHEPQQPDAAQHQAAMNAQYYDPNGYYNPSAPQYQQYQQAEYGYNAVGMNVPAPYNQNTLNGWFAFSDSSYLKGFFVGVGATLLLTNPTVQKALVRGTVKIWSLVQGGVEEVKEQIRDVQAEMSEES